MPISTLPTDKTPFLQQVADALLRAWGPEGFRNAAIFFPSTRARLFFTQHIASRLANQADPHPIWMPAWGNISSLFEEMAEMKIVDNLILLPQLHSIFLKHYAPSTLPSSDSQTSLDDFNDFFYWGQVLLHDFAQIDLYLCDAQQIFVNVEAIKQIDDAFDYLSEDQKRILQNLFDFDERKQSLNRFFKLLKQEDKSPQKLKQQFISIWQILWPVYNDLRSFMLRHKIGYSAHVARRAIERLQADQIDESTLQRLFPPRIAFAGFNALNRCEQALHEFIGKRYQQRQESALYFWNYSQPMIDDPLDEAGLFMRRHMALQRIDTTLSPAAPSRGGEWEIFAAPSTLAQVAILANILQKQIDNRGERATANTAIILADENLLLPLLRSLPPDVEHCNVTMGYPLRNTLVYSVLKSYLQLLASHDSSSFSYARSSLLDFLSHPYIATLEEASAFLATVANAQNERADADLLEQWPLSQALLHPLGVNDPIAAAQRLLSTIANSLNDGSHASQTLGSSNPEEPSLNADHLLTAFSILDTLRESLKQAEYPIMANDNSNTLPSDSARTLLMLLPKLFRDAKADFFGEPLEGLQIMGFLETRALDFDTVYILSANDDFLPRVSNRPSFIPRSIQRAFGLPTRSDHEAMYAYYFDTITMRAKHVVLIYTLGGEYSEPSRYILQRIYTPNSSELQIKKAALPLPSPLSDADIVIEKTAATRAILAQYLEESNVDKPKSLSPSSLHTYIICPLKFYYSRIANIIPQETDPKDNFDQRIFGTCVHAALEELYAPLVGTTLTAEALQAMAKPELIQYTVRNAFYKAINYPPADAPLESLTLRWRIYLRSTARYVESIVKTDLKRLNRIDSIVGLEYPIAGLLHFTDSNGEPHQVRMRGIIDRLDRLKDGKGFEIVDYKTGSFRRENAIFVGNEGLVSSSGGDYGYQLQILLYAMLLRQHPNFANRDISTGLWFPRCRDANFMIPALYHKENSPFQLGEYKHVIDSLTHTIDDVLFSLFDENTPFFQREKDNNCELCDFRKLCNR